jgi:hypothetical protein
MIVGMINVMVFYWNKKDVDQRFFVDWINGEN